jgi:hypothetical protein
MNASEKMDTLNSVSVGIGRPFLYAFSTYGVDGVDHALQILQVNCFAKYFGRFHNP